jgi:hypothetical protein
LLSFHLQCGNCGQPNEQNTFLRVLICRLAIASERLGHG